MLHNWLRPVNIKQFNSLKHIAAHQFGKKITIFYSEESLPDISKAQIAILGLDSAAADATRAILYTLSYPFRNLSVVDLGNARKKEPSFLIPILSELINNDIFPILIGDVPELNLPQFQAYQQKQKLVNLLIIDEKIPLTLRANAKPTYIDRILAVRKPEIFNLSFLGYQTHFISTRILDRLDQMNYECIRLGNIRKDITEVEPVVRDADLISFNISTLKSADAPGQSEATPSGLFLEEACQIARYAGLSDKLTSIGIYGFQPIRDYRDQTAHAISQLIYYFIDGFSNRKSDYPVSTEGLLEFIVEFKTHDYQLTFWKSTKSNRWWIQVPVRTRKKHTRHKLIPCSYQDYKQATKEELSERILKAFRRFD